MTVEDVVQLIYFVTTLSCVSLVRVRFRGKKEFSPSSVKGFNLYQFSIIESLDDNYKSHLFCDPCSWLSSMLSKILQAHILCWQSIIILCPRKCLILFSACHEWSGLIKLKLKGHSLNLFHDHRSRSEAEYCN